MKQRLEAPTRAKQSASANQPRFVQHGRVLTPMRKGWALKDDAKKPVKFCLQCSAECGLLIYHYVVSASHPQL